MFLSCTEIQFFTKSTEQGKFKFDDFQEYLEGISGGMKTTITATSILSDIQLYFDSVQTSPSSTMHNNYMAILNHHKNCMQNSLEYKPSTLAENFEE